MSNDKLVSIIIPVFNVERYLDECVNSILSQTYKNIEVILVDDGSTDHSGIMCDEYAETDSRIIVIHKENGGLSSARDVGIDNMKGDYVFFVDSDDYISLDTIETYIGLSKEYQADIVQGSFYEFYGDARKVPDRSICPTIEYTAQQALKDMLMDNRLVHAAAGSLYKSELFSEIRFPIGILYEDLATTYYIVSKVKKMVLCDDHRYYYRMRPGSIMNSNVSQKDMVLLDIVDIVTEKINHMFNDLHDACLRKKMVIYLKLYSRILYNGMSSFESTQNRIKKFIRSNAKEFLGISEIRTVDKIKVRSFLCGKIIFYIVYYLSDRIQTYKKGRA